MTTPTIIAFFDGAATSATVVYNNDSAIANAFGSLDNEFNISNDNSPIMLGPIRVTVSSAATIYKWQVPAEFELWELHVSPQPAQDGTKSAATLDNDNWRRIGVNNDGALVAHVEPKSLTVSYTVSMASASNRVVTRLDEIEIFSTGGAGSPSYHACISLLGYTKHRS